MTKFKSSCLAEALSGNTKSPEAHGGGCHFERFIRTIKTSLSSAIARKLFTFDEFTTVIKEVENIVNSRPLAYQGTDAEDVPLTPSQLVYGCDLNLLPPLLTADDEEAEDFEAKEL